MTQPAGHGERPSAHAAAAATWRSALVILVINAIGIVAFLHLRTDAMLAAAIDPLDPDWPAMQRAFGGYVLFATALLALLVAVVVRVAAAVGRRAGRRLPAVIRQHGPDVALAVALTTGVVLVLVDVLIFQDYGIHFYDFNVAGILANAALRRDLGIQPAQVAMVSLAACILLAVETSLCLVARHVASWRHGALPRAGAVALCAAGLLGFVLFRLSDRSITSSRADFEAVLPLGRVLLLRERSGPYIATMARLGRDGYATLASESAPTLTRRPNIVFFVPDGLRADMVTPALAPNLVRFGARTDVLHSQRHFSTGHVSESGIFGLTYGVNAQAYDAFLEARVASYPIAVLKQNGYRTLLISSSRINPYPSDQLLRLFDEVAYPPNDDAALAALTRFVDARRHDGVPYFVVAFMYTPHYPFTSAKPAFRKFPLVGPSARTNYMNDVLQADDYFRQTFDLVRADFEQGRTILLATSDHGEEIRDHGVFGHAPTTFWNEKVLVPFMLGLPGTRLPARVRQPERSSHVDVWPTIFDYLGVAAELPPRTYSDGRSLLHPSDSVRSLYVYGRYFPEADRPSAIIDGDRKYWFRVSGVAPNGRLCAEITRVTDLDDRILRDSAEDPSAIRVVATLQRDFWHFIRQPPDARPANCTLSGGRDTRDAAAALKTTPAPTR